MQIYLDTANINEIREAASWGILSGVTTNPSLMAREKGADFKSTISEIATKRTGDRSSQARRSGPSNNHSPMGASPIRTARIASTAARS